MDELIKKAIEALEKSGCNEVELQDAFGTKIRLVKQVPFITSYYPSTIPNEYQWQPTVT